MTAEMRYRALIVDDDPDVRGLTVRALMKEGFFCDIANDGVEAAQIVRHRSYDVVVTDLKMPNRHGHALALDLLQQENRPLIVVVTGVTEPRLSKDLMLRGVDDVIWKPVAYNTLAAKITALVHRRASQRAAAAAANANPG